MEEGSISEVIWWYTDKEESSKLFGICFWHWSPLRRTPNGWGYEVRFELIILLCSSKCFCSHVISQFALWIGVTLQTFQASSQRISKPFDHFRWLGWGDNSSTIFSGCFHASATYLQPNGQQLFEMSLAIQDRTYLVWLPLAAISPLLFVNTIDVYASVFPTGSRVRILRRKLGIWPTFVTLHYCF